MARAHARRHWLPYALLLISAASWGGNWAVARALYRDVPPFALTFWRWAVAAAVLGPFIAPELRREAALVRRHWPALAGFGIIGTAGFTMFGYWGVRDTTAINATLLNAALPVFIVPLSWFFHRLTVSLRQAAGLALSLAGVACIVSAGDPARLASLSLNPGDLMLLAGALLWALYTVLLRWRPALSPLVFLFCTIFAGAVFSLPFYLWEIAAGHHAVASAKSVLGIAYLVLFPSLLAYLCWNYAVPIVGPNVAGFFNPLIPIFGTLAAILLLGEELRPYHLAGFALAIAGVVLTSRR